MAYWTGVNDEPIQLLMLTTMMKLNGGGCGMESRAQDDENCMGSAANCHTEQCIV